MLSGWDGAVAAAEPRTASEILLLMLNIAFIPDYRTFVPFGFRF